MPLTATEGGGGDRQIVAAGPKIARCYLICDIGTQENTYAGDLKIVHQVVVGWEIPAERITIKDRDLPVAISKLYTLSLHEKANLRKDLDSWRGKSFTGDELGGFDLKNVLGVPCQLQVVHREGGNGKMYANVATVMGVPAGLDVPAAENPAQYFSLEEGGDIPENIPQWIVDKIHESHEWKDRQAGDAARDAEAGVVFPDEEPPTVGANDDLPF